VLKSIGFKCHESNKPGKAIGHRAFLTVYNSTQKSRLLILTLRININTEPRYFSLRSYCHILKIWTACYISTHNQHNIEQNVRLINSPGLHVNRASSSKRTTGETLKVFVFDVDLSSVFLELPKTRSSPSCHRSGRIFALQMILVSPSSVKCSSARESLNWDVDGVRECPGFRGLRSITFSLETWEEGKGIE